MSKNIESCSNLLYFSYNFSSSFYLVRKERSCWSI